MSKFKAFLIEEAEEGVNSSFKTIDTADLDPGEVLIKTAYSSVNFKDALAATGAGKIIRRFPCVGGIDLSGVVVESSSDEFKVGQEVIATSYDIGVAHHGGYAEYCRVPAKWVVPMPAGLDLFSSMALGTAGFTAGLAVERMEHNGLNPDAGPVLVNGATGGVGGIAIDILSALGYDVTAMTGKPEQSDYLKSLGAAEILDTASLDLAKIRPLGRETWAGVVDNLGGDILSWLASTVKVGGAIASIGLAASFKFNTTVMPYILRGVTLAGIDSVNAEMEVRRKVWGRLATDMKPKNLDKIVTTVAFDDLPATFEAVMQAKMRGRSVVKISD
ncbi:MAG TPA: oxidoreductase [Betaproteobacteria bacterium]|jgi:alcohol dehydrogenase|nr:oxidoreductase [Betaproteobacteria bacterium]HAT52573.1 oxidoreductase [Betaproteobacteria bacterium]